MEKKSSKSTQVLLNDLVQTYFNENPYVRNLRKSNELEVKFGTRGVKPLTKIDYDNVIKKIKSLGFKSLNEQGNYMLRIQNEFLDQTSGRFKMSNIRTEIAGFHAIQEYCNSNDITSLEKNYFDSITYTKKYPPAEFSDVNFDDFNFRVSYRVEENFEYTHPIIQTLRNTWNKNKKVFRYINRVTFEHDDYPVFVDISIVKSSTKVKIPGRRDGDLKKTYTTGESEVFTNPEIFEIELEVNNAKIGPSTRFNTVESIANAIRKVAKFVLMGLQGTNYPVSIPEQKNVLRDYLYLLHQEDKEFNIEKQMSHRFIGSNFIGPGSFTLQIQNIIPTSENINVPNIRKDYVVTEKADGQRHLMYISEIGKIYLINTSMSIIFTGGITKNPAAFNSLLDGELILHNKRQQFINLYAAFDIYYISKKDVRMLPFMELPLAENKESSKIGSRYKFLKNFIKEINTTSIVEGERSPITIESKTFYPKMDPASKSPYSIFVACKEILTKVDNGLFAYNTDGLIFTHAYYGVGGNAIGKTSFPRKITWEYSFKWKPPEFNTIDFLVTTKKNPNGTDVITPVFQDGINNLSVDSLTQYKSIILRCGFDERKHGYLNPCQDVLDDKLPEYSDRDNQESYLPVRFYPSPPYSDPNAGLCNVMLKKDDTGVYQMFSEDGEVFEDNTIVEFKYDFTRTGEWRWVPLRVRYDKTYDLRQTGRELGNAYHVADSNWKSINNPVTKEMITSGANIPDTIISDDDVYYNRLSSSTNTKALRDFHNLAVKKLLIKSVSKRNDILIDYACGKAGDLSKWIDAKLSFVFGVDVSKDNLENRTDGACARFLNEKKKFKHVPYVLFVNGNSGLNIRSGAAMMNDKAVQITRAVFGEGMKDDDRIGKAVSRQYGKGAEGFNVSSCQFAIHYFFKDKTTFQNFIRNVAECTKLNGYFIGTSYDGKIVFDMLKNKESVEIKKDEVKIWEVRKNYKRKSFPDDINSLGYQIEVFQESINKFFPEYLVNYDYLNRVMEDYGFKLVTRDEAKDLGLPEGSGLFGELFQQMLSEIKKNPNKKNEYGTAVNMTSYEKKISFLNRYFVYKKVRMVNAATVILEDHDVEEAEEDMEDIEAVKKTRVTIPKTGKFSIKKINEKLILSEKDEIVSSKVATLQKSEEEEPATEKKALYISNKPKSTIVLEEEIEKKKSEIESDAVPEYQNPEE
jgi:mRNA (guanine-N7-)-methyltransferase